MAEAFDVGVPGLRDDGFHALGIGRGETEAYGGAVVEDVDGVGGDAQSR